jgi:hypothetical protein
MPFTPSHLAAALPFARSPLLPSAVAIGTMAPDVPYYLPIRLPRDLTHSWQGAPTIDLLIAVILVLLWYAALRAPVVDLAPDAVRRRMPELGPLAWRRRGRGWLSAIATMLIGALAGILTHLVWDAFTHRGRLSELLPVLVVPVGPLPLVSWLQHLSTVAGLAIVVVWAIRWLRRTAPDAARRSEATPRARVAAWIAVVVASAATGLVVWWALIASGRAPFDPGSVFLVATTAGGAAGLTAVIVCSIWWIARAARSLRRT